MTRRLHDIVLLLGSLLDAPFAQPKTWTGQLVARNARRGQVPANRVPCPNCEGTKRHRVRGVEVPCDRCLSPRSGAPLGWIYVDLMIRAPYRRKVGSVETGAVVEIRTVACDVCGGEGVTLARRWRGDGNRCTRCGGSGRLELTLQQWRATRTVSYSMAPGTERISDHILEPMRLRAKAGSYDELMRALAELKEAWPGLYRLTLAVYVRGDQVTGAERHAAEAVGLEYLSSRMPRELKVPSSVRARDKARRLAA